MRVDVDGTGEENVAGMESGRLDEDARKRGRLYGYQSAEAKRDWHLSFTGDGT